MNLLIVTQKVDRNDSNLGFFHDWISAFSKNCQSVTVICLKKGVYDLPSNVAVLSLGKEQAALSASKSDLFYFRILYIFRFYKYIWQYRKKYDAVFIHMNSEYAVLAGWLWRLWRKKQGLWFTHGSLPMSLRVAERFVDVIFTASKSSCGLGSRKVKVMGHGIDLGRFGAKEKRMRTESGNVFRIISIGRISPSKDYETLIEAVAILKNRAKARFHVEIVGEPGTPDQEKYFKEIKIAVKNKKLDDLVFFSGSVPATQVPQKLLGADLFVHMSQTGSLDKAVLEAMASGLVVVSNNQAVKNDVFGEKFSEFVYGIKDSSGLAVVVGNVMALTEKRRGEIGKEMRAVVKKRHGLEELAKRIISEVSA